MSEFGDLSFRGPHAPACAGGLLALATAMCAASPAMASSSWQWFSFSEPRQVITVAADDSILIVQGPEGLFRSRNRGSTLDSSFPTRDGERITALARLRYGFFAATNRGIYLSRDAGISWTATWTRPGPGAPTGNVVGFRSSWDSVWAVLAPASGPERPGFRMLTLDGGRTWGAPREWSGDFAYDPVQAGDSLLAIGQAGLQCSRDGGKSWSPVPVDPVWGPFAHVSAASWDLFAVTRSGALITIFSLGIDFHRVALGSQDAWAISMATDGINHCTVKMSDIACSRDGGVPGAWTWENPFSGSPELTISRGFVYVAASRDFAERGIGRGDLATGAWEILDVPEAFGPYAPLLSARSDTLLALSRKPDSPILISLDRGRTWDSLASRPAGLVPDGFFQSEGVWGISGAGEDHNLAIYLSRDRGVQWSRLPANPAAIIRGHPVVAWDGCVYVGGDRGGLWKGDMRSGLWSLVGTPASTTSHTGGISPSATDEALFLLQSDGYWRLEKEAATASRPAARRPSPPARAASLAFPGNGPVRVRVIPGPEIGARPDVYDLKGARMRNWRDRE